MCVLNPIEMVWNIFKQRIRKSATSKSKINEIVEIGLDALSEIPNQMVVNCANHVKKIEDDFWQKEGMLEETSIGPIVISLDDDNEEWDEDSEEEVLDEDSFVNVWD